MNQGDLAYMAGFIDGEGSIMYTRNGVGKRGLGYFRLIFSITSVDIEIIDWIVLTFPQYKWTRETRKFNNPNHKDAFTLKVQSDSAAKFIRLVEPYLRIKKPQARVALLADYYNKLIRGCPGATKKLKLLEPIKQKLARQMKQLNHRGK